MQRDIRSTIETKTLKRKNITHTCFLEALHHQRLYHLLPPLPLSSLLLPPTYTTQSSLLGEAAVIQDEILTAEVAAVVLMVTTSPSDNERNDM